MKFAVASLILILSSQIFSAPDAQVEGRGSRIFISDGVLFKDSVDKIVALSKERTLVDVQRIHLKDIPGGTVGAGHRLYSAFAGKIVEVDGYCASTCANLALAGAEVQLNHDGLLLIHGVYRPDSGRWLESESLELVDWLSSRLPTIPREALVKAVSYPKPDGQWLALYPVLDGSGLIAARLCDPIPDNCKLVRYLSPGESRLSVAEELRLQRR